MQGRAAAPTMAMAGCPLPAAAIASGLVEEAMTANSETPR